MRGAFITAAAAANRVLVLWAFFGVGFEYSLKDLLDRLDLAVCSLAALSRMPWYRLPCAAVLLLIPWPLSGEGQVPLRVSI
jgi:predicted Kef-type K+ transport protein